MPAGHVWPPQPVRTSSWSLIDCASSPSKSMFVSPAAFEFGSETKSSVTPATGSKGGDGLRLSMAVRCAGFCKGQRRGCYWQDGEKTKQEAVMIRFKIRPGVYEHMALSNSPAAACPSFFLGHLICDGPKVMFFLATIVFPRQRPSIVPACRALGLPQMASKCPWMFAPTKRQ